MAAINFTILRDGAICVFYAHDINVIPLKGLHVEQNRTEGSFKMLFAVLSQYASEIA